MDHPFGLLGVGIPLLMAFYAFGLGEEKVVTGSLIIAAVAWYYLYYKD